MVKIGIFNYIDEDLVWMGIIEKGIVLDSIFVGYIIYYVVFVWIGYNDWNILIY